MITIDGVNYKANWIESTLKRKAEIINGDASGRLQKTKAMYLDYVGTFYNYSGDLRREKGCSDTEWETLYIVLSNPINNHSIALPFGNGTITNDYYISSVESKFVKSERGYNEWEKAYSVAFTAMSPQRLATSPNTITGVSNG